MWVDAPAAEAVLEQLPGRVYMVGAQATDFVPLTTAFRQRLAADATTPAARSVHTMASDPLLVFSQAENQGGAYWWDPLTAVAASVRGIVRYATSADGDAFHTTFLNVHIEQNLAGSRLQTSYWRLAPG